ncbi:MAG TPA: methyltransferase type 11, partial [Stenotrophomonas sp.]|nr:methyltransferase type 11 [Stenotrophomonas sp.]
MSDDVINSKSYWNGRFGEDWEDLGGREQSRFFGALAVQMLPAWLVRASSQRRLTWCDWGCALGDGTQEVAQSIPGAMFTGVDFSAVAIADAKQRFPGLSFISD